MNVHEIVDDSGVDVIKLLTSSLTLKKIKLERFSFEFFHACLIFISKAFPITSRGP